MEKINRSALLREVQERRRKDFEPQRNAVRKAFLRGGRSLSQLADDFEISLGSAYNWTKDLKKQAAELRKEDKMPVKFDRPGTWERELSKKK